jgi:hypothetical protein
VETAGNGNLQTKTNKNYENKNRLDSGKQVVRPISAQTLVDWRLSECGNKFNGVYTEANRVKGAEAADFFCHCWHLKVITDKLVVLCDRNSSIAS